MRSRKRVALAALVLLVGLLAACGSEQADEPVESDTTTASGTLVIYSGRNEELVGPLLDMFTEKTGIEVEVRYANSAELSATILEEGDASPADVFLSQDAGALGALDEEGILRSLDQETLDQVDTRFQAESGTWVGVSGRARVLVYDPAQVSEVPESVFDLTDEAWSGKVAWAPTNASFQAFVTAMRVTAGEDVARQWLEDMQANGTVAYESNDLILAAVEEGQAAIGLINHYYWAELVAEEGAENVSSKIAFLPGEDPGALVNVAGVGVLESATHSAEADAFVDFLLSEEAQRYFSEETFEYPLAAGVDADPSLPPLATLGGPSIDLSSLSSLEETLALLADTGVTS